MNIHQFLSNRRSPWGDSRRESALTVSPRDRPMPRGEPQGPGWFAYDSAPAVKWYSTAAHRKSVSSSSWCGICGHLPLAARPTTSSVSPPRGTDCTPRHSREHWPGPPSRDGRRIHDLRHTAACLWLARGVDPVTVQAWMGHIDCHHQHLSASSGNRGGSGRFGRSEPPGAHGSTRSALESK